MGCIWDEVLASRVELRDERLFCRLSIVTRGSSRSTSMAENVCFCLNSMCPICVIRASAGGGPGGSGGGSRPGSYSHDGAGLIVGYCDTAFECRGVLLVVVVELFSSFDISSPCGLSSIWGCSVEVLSPGEIFEVLVSKPPGLIPMLEMLNDRSAWPAASWAVQSNDWCDVSASQLTSVGETFVSTSIFEL
jgi:hypothetical protein